MPLFLLVPYETTRQIGQNKCFSHIIIVNLIGALNFTFKVRNCFQLETVLQFTVVNFKIINLYKFRILEPELLNILE